MSDGISEATASYVNAESVNESHVEFHDHGQYFEYISENFDNLRVCCCCLVGWLVGRSKIKWKHNPVFFFLAERYNMMKSNIIV